MKSITRTRPTRITSAERAGEQAFDPEVAFADPVGYLASLGIDSRLVSMRGPASVQKAA